MTDKESKSEQVNIFKFINILGISAFAALTLVQSLLSVIWLYGRVFSTTEEKKLVFDYKGLVAFLLLGVTFFFLIKIITEKVIGNKVKPWYFIAITAYILSIPQVESLIFDATLFAVCFVFELLLIICFIVYFYGEHEMRLFGLIGIFAILVILSILNRPAFWLGELLTVVFLTIQLVRNIKTKKKNIGDKSWRNTLLLFCILIIIMLMPEYCRYNNIKHTLYHSSVNEQLAARFLVPYLEKEKIEGNTEYLLGVIDEGEFYPGRPYEEFKRIMHSYEDDGYDMDVIWSNLYHNAYYKYRRRWAINYAKNLANGYIMPFVMLKEMDSTNVLSHHGHYYSLFQKNNPYISNIYMKFGTYGLMGVTAVLIIQLLGVVILDIVKGKFKLKVETGHHMRIEAVIFIFVLLIFWNVLQTLFALEGVSYIVSIPSTVALLAMIPFAWLRDIGKKDN